LVVFLTGRRSPVRPGTAAATGSCQSGGRM